MYLPVFLIVLAASPAVTPCETGSVPTPPAITQLAALRSMKDVIGVSVLADGTRAPDNIVLPTIVNRRQTLEYMRVHYPDVKKRKPSDARPVAWVCVDKRGRVGGAKLVNGTGEARFDSLSLNVFSVAAFTPALVGADTVELWFPLPAAIPSKDELEMALAADGFDKSMRPTQTAFTEAPQLLNRSRIEDAVLRVIHNVNNAAVARTEIFNRAQQSGGTALVWIYIDQAGNVTNSVLKKKSGNTDLDIAAQQIVATMRFLPAKLDGKPVDVWIEVPLVFRSSR